MVTGNTRIRRVWYHRRLNVKRIFSSTLGAVIGMGVLSYLSKVTGCQVMMPPLGATCFIAFIIPDSAFAKPRSVIGGHIVSGMIGYLFIHLGGTQWWEYPLALGLTIGAMQVLRVLHPPAAANPLLIIDGHSALADLVGPVFFGSVIVAGIAAVFNRIIVKQRYFRIVLHHVANVSESTRCFKLG